jgi:hypothetical protein
MNELYFWILSDEFDIYCATCLIVAFEKNSHYVKFLLQLVPVFDGIPHYMFLNLRFSLM